MDGFQFVLIVSFVIGSGLIIYSIINFHGKDEPDDFDMSALVGHKLNELDSTADNAMNDLNDMSKVIFKQFDEKYQELLFLYNLVDEKKQELENGSRQRSNSGRAVAESSVDIVVDENMAPVFRNHKFTNILKLKNEGMDVSDIAKTLGIGKGEVSLILELGKGRRV